MCDMIERQKCKLGPFVCYVGKWRTRHLFIERAQYFAISTKMNTLTVTVRHNLTSVQYIAVRVKNISNGRRPIT